MRYQAIEIVDKLAIVDIMECDGCGLCVGVCPTNAVDLALRVNVS